MRYTGRSAGNESVALTILIIIVLILMEWQKEEPDMAALSYNILLSIVCSLIASGIFTILQSVIASDSQGEMMKALTKIDRSLQIREELYDSGIVSIRKKSYYDRDGSFWKKMILFTTDRLDLLGHSLSNWFDEEYREIFTKKILDMMARKKDVRIILSGSEPDFSKIRRVERGELQTSGLNKIERTCYEFRKIVRDAAPEKRKHLQVYRLSEREVTYMYIRTDKQCFISPYIHSVTAASNSFLLELEVGIDYSRCFEKDFSEMMSEISPINLEE